MSMKRNRFLKFCHLGLVAAWKPETAQSGGNGALGQQIAVLAKGDEHDAVEQPLGHFNGLVERVRALEMEV